MKKKILYTGIGLFIVGILMTSCEENSNKKSVEVEKDIRETNQQIDQKAADIREETRKDWEDFKAASDEALEKRENEITDLRAEIAKADKKKREVLNRELDELEKRNRTLKERIAARSNNIKSDLSDLNEKAIEDHRAAQRELKHDMDELGKSIGNFFKNNSN